MNQETLKALFTQFNREYFNGELPEPRLLLSRSRTRLGSMAYKRKRSWGRVRNSDYTIRISTYYDCGEREWQNVLLHEMIHLYIASKRLRDTSSHGKLFRQYMDHLNSNYGWNIRVSTSTRGWQPTVAPKRKRHTVLALRMKSGKCFLTVVNPQYVARLKQQIETIPDVGGSWWFESDDDYFNDFSVVRSLRGRSVDPKKFEEWVSRDDAFWG